MNFELGPTTRIEPIRCPACATLKGPAMFEQLLSIAHEARVTRSMEEQKQTGVAG